jgi:hypothetical protein
VIPGILATADCKGSFHRKLGHFPNGNKHDPTNPQLTIYFVHGMLTPVQWLTTAGLQQAQRGFFLEHILVIRFIWQ